MSEVKTEKLSPRVTSLQLGDSGDTFTVPSGATLDIASGATLDTTGATVTGLSAGKVLQVVSALKNDTFSSNSTSFFDITGLSASITPSSTSNKILVMAMVGCSGSGSYTAELNLVRDSTNIAQPSGGSAPATGKIVQRHSDVVEMVPLIFLDSPSSTSSLTYKVQGRSSHTSLTLAINYMTASSGHTTVSSLTLMEIEG